MEINKMKSNLKMTDLYFSHCSVERACNIQNGEYNADLKRNITQIKDHQYSVELELAVQKEDLSVLVVAKANFEYVANKYDEMEESIVKSNTVAIMFPYIRSQVTLLTTQPGMTPIVLPPINTTKFS